MALCESSGSPGIIWKCLEGIRTRSMSLLYTANMSHMGTWSLFMTKTLHAVVYNTTCATKSCWSCTIMAWMTHLLHNFNYLVAMVPNPGQTPHGILLHLTPSESAGGTLFVYKAACEKSKLLRNAKLDFSSMMISWCWIRVCSWEVISLHWAEICCLTCHCKCLREVRKSRHH